MSDFHIFETDEFAKSLQKLSSRDSVFLRKKLDEFAYPQLRAEPFWGNNVKKLKGYSPNTWRYRIGRFRVFYAVAQAEKIVFILTVDDRKDTYR